MNLMPKKTVASITSGLGKLVLQLEAHRSKMLDEKAMLEDECVRLAHDISEAGAEAERAARVAGKIKALLED